MKEHENNDGIVVIDSWKEIAPGKWVTHTSAGGKGMVVAVNDDQLTVLWSQEPRGDVRRVHVPLIAKEIFKVQPMTMPAGAIFYMDYTYESEKDKLCTTGPWVNRIFWRTCRWALSLKTRLSWSSLCSWARSRFGRRSTSTSMPVLTDDEYRKMLIEKWAPVLKGTTKDE